MTTHNPRIERQQIAHLAKRVYRMRCACGATTPWGSKEHAELAVSRHEAGPKKEEG